jgi:uncharacterized membrane protein YdcZ (DUF606 family)
VVNVLSLLAALVIGIGAAVQTSMLGAMGRSRGPTEAAWLSILGTVCSLGALMAARVARGDVPLLPAPFDRGAVYAVVALAAGIGMLLAIRGIAPYFAVTGLFGLAFIVGAATIAPRLGVALFLSATIAGQLLGAMALDGMGAFGGAVHSITPMRVAGATMLLAGVALVRGFGR